MGILSSEVLMAATCCIKKSEYRSIGWKEGRCIDMDERQRYRKTQSCSMERYSFMRVGRDRSHFESCAGKNVARDETLAEGERVPGYCESEGNDCDVDAAEEDARIAWEYMCAHATKSMPHCISSKQMCSVDTSGDDTDTTSASMTSMTDTLEGFEWGWFDDLDDYEEESDMCGLHFPEHQFGSYRRKVSSAVRSRDKKHSINSSVVKRQVSSAFQMCRTFAPLRFPYDVAYMHSDISWLHSLPSNRHLFAQLQIRMFRIVQSESLLGESTHAEFHIEVSVDGHYKSQWLRFSSIARFVSKLPWVSFRNTHQAWGNLNDSSRWFNRLELNYLHQRCKLLERFAYTFLLECPNAHTLAELLEHSMYGAVESDSSTLHVRHRLQLHKCRVRSASFDMKRRQTLVYGEQRSADTGTGKCLLRSGRFYLYSFEAVVKEVALFDRDYFPWRYKGSVEEACKFVNMQQLHLFYSEPLDIFICVFAAILKAEEPKNQAAEFFILCLQPQSLTKVISIAGQPYERLNCCAFDVFGGQLAIASTLHWPLAADNTAGSAEPRKSFGIKFFEITKEICANVGNPGQPLRGILGVRELRRRISLDSPTMFLACTKLCARVFIVAISLTDKCSLISEWKLQDVEASTPKITKKYVEAIERTKVHGDIFAMSLTPDDSWLLTSKENGSIEIWCVNASLLTGHMLGGEPYRRPDAFVDCNTREVINSFSIITNMVKNHQHSSYSILTTGLIDSEIIHWNFVCRVEQAADNKNRHIPCMIRSGQYPAGNASAKSAEFPCIARQSYRGSAIASQLVITMRTESVADQNLSFILLRNHSLLVMSIHDLHKLIWSALDRLIVAMTTRKQMHRRSELPIYCCLTDNEGRIEVNFVQIAMKLSGISDLSLLQKTLTSQKHILVSVIEWVKLNQSETEEHLVVGFCDGSLEIHCISCRENLYTSECICTIADAGDRVAVSALDCWASLGDNHERRNYTMTLCVGHIDGGLRRHHIRFPGCVYSDSAVFPNRHSESIVRLMGFHKIDENDTFKHQRMLLSFSVDGMVKVWNPTTMKLSLSFLAGTSRCHLTAADIIRAKTATMATRTFLATGNKEGKVSVWQLNTKKEIAQMHLHTSRVCSIHALPDTTSGSFVVGSWDGSLSCCTIDAEKLDVVRTQKFMLAEPIVDFIVTEDYVLVASQHRVFRISITDRTEYVHDGLADAVNITSLEEPTTTLKHLEVVPSDKITVQTSPKRQIVTLMQKRQANDLPCSGRIQKEISQFYQKCGNVDAISIDQFFDFLSQRSDSWLRAARQSSRMCTRKKVERYLTMKSITSIDINLAYRFIEGLILETSIVSECGRISATKIKLHSSVQYNEFGEKVVIPKTKKAFKLKKHETRSGSPQRHDGKGYAHIMKYLIPHTFKAIWPPGYCWCDAETHIQILSNHQKEPPRCSLCAGKKHTTRKSNSFHDHYFGNHGMSNLFTDIVRKLGGMSYQIIMRAERCLKLPDVRNVIFQLFSIKYGAGSAAADKVKLLLISICHGLSSDSDSAFVLGHFIGILPTSTEGSPGSCDYLLALCISMEIWLRGRQRKLECMDQTDPVGSVDYSGGFANSKVFYVCIDTVLLCVKELCNYPVASPAFRQGLILTLQELDAFSLSEEIEDHELCISNMQSYRALIEFYQLEYTTFRESRYRLFQLPVLQNVDKDNITKIHASESSAVMSKLELILGCFTYWDRDRSGAMPVSVFEALWRKLRFLWMESNQTFSEKLMKDADMALEAAKSRFIDFNYDGYMSYIDFWAMLYVFGTRNNFGLMTFDQIAWICRYSQLQIPSDIQTAITDYMEKLSLIIGPVYDHDKVFSLSISFRDDDMINRGWSRGTIHLDKTKSLADITFQTVEIIAKNDEVNKSISLRLEGDRALLRQTKSASSLRTTSLWDTTFLRASCTRENQRPQLYPLAKLGNDKKPAALTQSVLEVAMQPRRVEKCNRFLNSLKGAVPEVLTRENFKDRLKPRSTTMVTEDAQLEFLLESKRNLRISDGSCFMRNPSTKSKEARKQASLQALSRMRVIAKRDLLKGTLSPLAKEPLNGRVQWKNLYPLASNSPSSRRQRRKRKAGERIVNSVTLHVPYTTASDITQKYTEEGAIDEELCDLLPTPLVEADSNLGAHASTQDASLAEIACPEPSLLLTDTSICENNINEPDKVPSAENEGDDLRNSAADLSSTSEISGNEDEEVEAPSWDMEDVPNHDLAKIPATAFPVIEAYSRFIQHPTYDSTPFLHYESKVYAWRPSKKSISGNHFIANNAASEIKQMNTQPQTNLIQFTDSTSTPTQIHLATHDTLPDDIRNMPISKVKNRRGDVATKRKLKEDLVGERTHILQWDEKLKSNEGYMYSALRKKLMQQVGAKTTSNPPHGSTDQSLSFKNEKPANGIEIEANHAHDAYSADDYHQVLTKKEPLYGIIFKPNTARYYSLEVTPKPSADIIDLAPFDYIIQLRLLRGEANLFMAIDTPIPSIENHQWRATAKHEYEATSNKVQRDSQSRFPYQVERQKKIILHQNDIANAISAHNVIASRARLYLSVFALDADTRYCITLKKLHS